jgi:hypothetical protein
VLLHGTPDVIVPIEIGEQPTMTRPDGVVDAIHRRFP